MYFLKKLKLVISKITVRAHCSIFTVFKTETTDTVALRFGILENTVSSNQLILCQLSR
jgi:hypothetical protein